jgi:predicted permease
MMAGYILTKLHILNSESRKHLSNLLINFILPCNILVSFMIEFNQKILTDCFAVLLVSIVIQLVCLFTSKYFFPKAAPRQLAVLRYGTISSNAGYLGNPIAQGLYGNIGLLYASIYLIPMRIVMWSIGVTCFTESKSKGVLKKTLTHPCIVAVFLGILLMISQLQLPTGIVQTLKYAGNANTALSMIVIGNILAEVKVSELFDLKALWFCVVRLLIIPILVILGCSLFGVDELVKQVSVILAGMPAATTIAILAAKYDGDAPFTAKIIFLSTVFSMITVPLLCIIMN